MKASPTSGVSSPCFSYEIGMVHLEYGCGKSIELTRFQAIRAMKLLQECFTGCEDEVEKIVPCNPKSE